MQFANWLQQLRARHQSLPASQLQQLAASVAAMLAISSLVWLVQAVSAINGLLPLVLASMGASTFLLFVAPHSPMAQPWPLLAGHGIAAVIGLLCLYWLGNGALSTGLAVGLAVYLMYGLGCLHPPSAATAMIAVLAGGQLPAWQFLLLVLLNAMVLLLLAMLLNRCVPGRYYPYRDQHHDHHQGFQSPQPRLVEQDFDWALQQLDSVTDVSAVVLVDLYEFAAEHAQQRARR